MRRARARDLGITPGPLPTGRHNAVTDVTGVLVGHVSLLDGEGIATGVTAVRPHPGNIFRNPVAAGLFVGNGFGKFVGATQVMELGTLETPVVLTNTLSVPQAIEGILTWVLRQEGNEEVRSVNAVVGETNDGYLNDIRGRHVREAHVVEAITKAASGPVAEGSVGAGTGTMCFGWKGGIGTSSRVLPDGVTVGVLVQTNYGGDLRVAGRSVPGPLGAPTTTHTADGSCMIVVATDMPLSVRPLERLAARAVYAMARTGSTFSTGSGDYALAFSTTSSGTRAERRMHRSAPGHSLSRLFAAAMDATEEALYDSLLMATTVTGHQGHVGPAIPLDLVTG